MLLIKNGLRVFTICYFLAVCVTLYCIFLEQQNINNFKYFLLMSVLAMVGIYFCIYYLVEWVLTLFLPKGIPYFIKEHAYIQQWRLHRDKAGLLPENNKIAFNYNHCGLGLYKNTCGLIDGYIPAVVSDGKVGLYKIHNRPYRKSYNGFHRLEALDDIRACVDLELMEISSYVFVEKQLLKNWKN